MDNKNSMVCSNEAMCDPWVNPEQYVHRSDDGVLQ